MKSTYKVTILALLCVAFLAIPALATDEDGIGGVSPFPPAAEEEAPPTEGLTCLNFDDLAPGTALTTYGGVRFANTHGGLTVQSAYPGPVFTSPNSVLPDNYSSSGNRSRATFSAPVSEASVTMGDYGADSDNLYLKAYDSSNNLVDSDLKSIPSGLGGGVDLLVSGSNIAYVEFYGRGLNENSVYFDNLCFTQAQTCDYCLTDDYGYKWCLNVITTDGRAYYLEGTCDTGTTPLKDAHATYLYSTEGLTMTAWGGATGYIFSYNTKFITGTRARGVWVNSLGSGAYVDTWLIDCGTASEAEIAPEGPAPDLE
jgi:hypothetical protein